MASKEVVIESMWSPAVALLVAQGVNCRYAFPKEGMRGWCSAQGIPKHVTGEKLQAAYRYLNWMYEGFLGALIMRQGYYVANGKNLPKWLRSNRAKTTGKPAFTAAEYEFWYNGKPAATRPPGHHGPGRRHQEGPGARRRLVPQARLQVHRPGTRSTRRTCTR